MKYIGAHVSVSGGVERGPSNAMAIGANALALFTKNQRQWRAKPLTEASITAFKTNLKVAAIDPKMVLVHDSYLINLGNPDKEKRAKSLHAFIDEVIRCEALGLCLLNFHPGSHLNKSSEEECLKIIAEGMNQTLDETTTCTLVIENTAGQGTNVGYRFEHLARLIELTEDKSRVGVCLDTCHTFAAGYDLSTPEGFEETLQAFDAIVGFAYLKGVHLNDSKKGLGSRVDRHEITGEGEMGVFPFKKIMSDRRFDDIPLILETPNSAHWAQEIEALRAFEAK